MNPTHLLDTGWIVRHFRGDGSYTRTLARIGPAQLTISIISLAELYEGVCRARDRAAANAALRLFLSDKTVLPIAGDVCHLFGEHRARLRQNNQLIGDFDLLIGATCLHQGLRLLTTNPRHFERLPGLTVVSTPDP